MYASLTTPIGKIFQPLLDAVGAVLAFFYSLIPNYPVDVALLTVVIMALLTPLTVKSTKNMAAMQALGPEMKKLQQKYKGAENRAQLNEEMMKLYKEHKVNPASGCLPMLLQMPAFFILYSVIRGITNTVAKGVTIPYTLNAGTIIPNKASKCTETVCADPRYTSETTKMYHDIVAAHGQLISFGMDFSQKLLSHHSSIFVAIPFLLLVVGSVGLQYLQMSRLNKRNGGAAQANPQAAMLQKYMPLIFGFIYINVAAILNVYFIISSAIRIATQEILFRRGMVGGPPPTTVDVTATEKKKPKGPVVDRTERALPKPKTGSGSGTDAAKKKATPPARSGGSGGTNANGRTRRPAQAAADVDAAATVKRAGSTGGTNGKRTPSSANGNGSRRGPGKPSGNGSNGSNGSGGSATASSGSSAPKEHPRSKAKRERKAR
jgi:YidC/Oxa1 family membrane protein insertase